MTIANSTIDRAAVILFSDPQNTSDESLGRAFNALATALDYDMAGWEVRLIFQGAGTRWPELLDRPDHPIYDLYQAVRHTVAGASCGCADVFGAAEAVRSADVPLLTDNPVPGTTGVSSFRNLAEAGFVIHTF